ncbi:MAG: hypothetical protein ACTHJ8_17970 [Mucilaginibacter sp.]|jgi:hypothetical protein
MNTLECAVNFREERLKNQKPKNKVIKDFRVYAPRLPEKVLYPYDYQYAEIFLNILRNKELTCPTYHHLYVQVAKSFEDCLKGSIALEDWYVCGLAVIDYDNYLKQTNKEKEEIVLNAIIDGLNDITNIDGLDQSIINSTIDEVKKSGLDTELKHLTAENKDYLTTVTYFSRSMEEGNPIFLNIKEKSTGKSGRIQIGIAEKNQLYFWISKLTLNKSHVKIKARSLSAKADLYLMDKPRSMEFSIKKIING